MFSVGLSDLFALQWQQLKVRPKLCKAHLLLLVTLWFVLLQGKQVVRLKGGCPSVFSRCSSEIAALGQDGISWELVPGISSALAGPLLAGESPQ